MALGWGLWEAPARFFVFVAKNWLMCPSNLSDAGCRQARVVDKPGSGGVTSLGLKTRMSAEVTL